MEYESKKRKIEKPRPFDGHKFTFLCHSCGEHKFTTDDLRLYDDSLRIVLSSSFLQLIKFKHLPEPEQKGPLTRIKIIHCKKCNQKLGGLKIGKKLNFYNPSIELFFVEHAQDCAKCEVSGAVVDHIPTVYKSWDKVPFSQAKMTPVDVKKHLNLLLPTLGKEKTPHLDALSGVPMDQ